ncbi:MAG: bis(5'-nucleosyl)-tetraphosphatase (symmetrical) YqeK [Oscillospiraceae bacterium]|nr:bis(5'-nucleosyl)-tetraphosphatase (symmetrical) YqeK [Oscillospiraceae bacterium]
MRDILSEVEKRLSPKRFAHTLGTAECAVALARRFGEDPSAAYQAGLLHDVTKEWSPSEQLNFFEKHGIMISNVQKLTPELFHPISGAVVAKEEFGMEETICNAIRWHTTGRAGMSCFEQILWLADLIEPGRNFPGVEELRALATSDLSAAVCAGMSHSILFLVEHDRLIDTQMIDARNWFLSERK